MAAPANVCDSSSGAFISLQDICKLHVLFNLELFPDDSLSQLPRSIRNRLYGTLPVFDRLHYENARFCSDLDIKDICFPPEDKKRVLVGSHDEIKEKLVKCMFTSEDDLIVNSNEGCGLDLREASEFIDCFPSIANKDQNFNNRFKFLKHYQCKVVIMVDSNWQCNQDISSFARHLVIPTRLMKFLSAHDSQFLSPFMYMKITNASLFMSYCNLHTVLRRGLSSLSIDTIQLFTTPFWREYTSLRIQTIVDHTICRKAGVPEIDPVSPLVQDILACVEHLSIGTREQFEPSAYDEEDLSIDAPNLILNNIVSHEKPRLKSIHIHGIARSVVDTVVTVGAFLCGTEDCPVVGMNNRSIPEGDVYSLVPPSSKLCSIEKIRISADSGDYDYVKQYLLADDSATICNTVLSILKHHKATLTSLSLRELGYTYVSLDTSSERLDSSSLDHADREVINCDELGYTYVSLDTSSERLDSSSLDDHADLEVINCDEYRTLLNSALVEFVQLPQFEFLELGDSPDTECYPLILAFLTTPTSHEQKLIISLRPDSEPAVLDWIEQYPIPTSSPHSNTQFKSLVLNGQSKLINHILNFPNLSLKSLSQHSTQISSNTLQSSANTRNIQFVRFSFGKTGFTIPQLDMFVSQNTCLKSLTLVQDTGGYFRKMLHNLNQCLLRLVERNRTLDSISLQNVNFLENFFSNMPIMHQQWSRSNAQQQYLQQLQQRFPDRLANQGAGIIGGSPLMQPISPLAGIIPAGTGPAPTQSAAQLSMPLMQGSPAIQQSSSPLTQPGPSHFTGSDEQGYDFNKWMPSSSAQQNTVYQLGPWFTLLPHQSDNIPAKVTDSDVFLFLCLVQKLDAALTITSERPLEPHAQDRLEHSLIPLLEEAFGDTNVKIRKVALNRNLKDSKKEFERVASCVEII